MKAWRQRGPAVAAWTWRPPQPSCGAGFLRHRQQATAPDRDAALVHHAECAVSRPGYEPECVGTRAEILDLEHESHAGLSVDGGATGDRGARRLDRKGVDRRGIHAGA